MKVRKASKGKVISSFIIGTLLMFSITVTILSGFIKFIVLNPNTYIRTLEKKETYNQIYTYLDGNLEYILTINDIGIEVKDDIINKGELEEEINNFIKSLIKYFIVGESVVENVDYEKYSKRFSENLDKYIRDKSIFINNNTQEQIELLKNEATQIIKSELEIINTDIIFNSSIIAKISKIASVFYRGIYLFPLILVALFIVIIKLIWKSDNIRFYQWIGNSIISAGIFNFVLFFSGYISYFYNDVAIYVVYLKDFFAELIKTWLLELSLVGILSCLIGSIMIIPIIKNYIKRSKMVRKNKYREIDNYNKTLF